MAALLGHWRCFGMSRVAGIAALFVALAGAIGPGGNENNHNLDSVLEEIVLQTIEDARWIATDPWLQDALSSGERIALFDDLASLAPVASTTDAVLSVVRTGDGEVLAWDGWTPLLAIGRHACAVDTTTYVRIEPGEPIGLVLAHFPLEGGSVEVARPLTVAAPLDDSEIRPPLPRIEGWSLPSILAPIDTAAISWSLPDSLAFPTAAAGSVLEDGRESTAQTHTRLLGAILALLLLLRSVREEKGSGAVLWGWLALLLLRLLLLHVRLVDVSIWDPTEFVLLLPAGWPPSLQQLLGSPGDTALSFLAVSFAFVLGLRGLVWKVRRTKGTLPIIAAPLALASVAGIAYLWTLSTAAFASAAGRPPFVDITALENPAILAVAVSVALLGAAAMVVILGSQTAFLAALPTQRRSLLSNLLPLLAILIAAGISTPSGWLLALAAAALWPSAHALLQRRSLLGPSSIAAVVLIGLASAAELQKQQARDYEYFAEEQARRTWQRQSLEVSLLESAVDDMLAAGELGRALTGSISTEEATFHAWMSCALALGRRPCQIQLRDQRGRLVSQFRIDMPGHLTGPFWAFADTSNGVATRRAVSRVGQKEWQVLVATARVKAASEFIGQVSVAVLPDGPDRVGSQSGEMTHRLSRWGADPIVLRYRNGVLVDSNAADAPIGDLLPAETQGLFEQKRNGLPGGWREALLDGRRFRIYWTLQPDGQVLGIGLPVGLHGDIVTLALNAIAVHGVVLLAFALTLALGGGMLRRVPRLAGLFRVRLMVAIVAVAVFPILFWGSVSTQRLLREHDQSLRDDLEQRLDTALGAVELDLTMAMKRLFATGRAELIAGLENNDESIAGVLSAFVAVDSGSKPRQREIDGGRVYDSRGVEIARVGATAPIPPSILDAVLRRGENKVFYQSIEDRPVLALARPVALEDGSVTGAVVGYRRLNTAVCEHLHELLLSEVRIYGREQIASTSRRELIAAGLAPDRLPARIWRAIMGSGRPQMTEREWGLLGARWTAYRALRLNDVVTVGAISLSQPYWSDYVEDRAVARSISLIVSLSALWLGISVAAGLFLSRRISDPLQRVIRGAGRLTAGELGIQIAADGRDELARLARVFNRMSRSLADNRDELETQRAALEAIIRHLDAGVIAADPSGRIHLSNPGADAMLGERESLHGEFKQRLLASDLVGAQSLLDAFESTDHISRELPWGENRTVRITMTRLGGAAATSTILIVIEDLTDLIRSQKTLAWAQMARQVAHEIKNPLTPMKLQAQNLLYAYRQSPESFAETLSEGVGIIVEQIERLRRISGEFSRMSRPESLGSGALDLGAAVEEALKLYKGADTHSVRVAVRIDDGVPPIRIDHEDVVRVVLNLVENARDALLAGTEQGLVNVRVLAETDEGRVVGATIEVEDNGPGIPAEIRPRLFEPYFSTKTSGTGLGLSIVNKIVDGSGGSIEVTSEEGKGTCFRIHLPAAREKA
jgi:signal transduction histidine kinase/HAMP domain-containing protein